MKKLAILGNCQIYALQNYLAGNKLFSEEWEIVSIPPVFEIADGNETLEILKTVDYIATQPLYSVVGGCDMSIDALRSLNNNLIVFPNVYFDGYNPELFYLTIDGGLAKSPLLDYTLANILLSYLEGDAVDACVERWYSHESYSSYKINIEDKNAAIDNAEASLDELKRRETSCDLVTSIYIQDRIFIQRIFYTMNHPDASIMNNVAAQIFYRLLGRSSGYVNSEFELFAHTVIPMLPSVKSVFSFHESNIFRINNNPYEPINVVSESYNWFSKYSNTQLSNGLSVQLTTKPLLIKLLGIKESRVESS